MSYTLVYEDRARKDLKRLDAGVARRVELDCVRLAERAEFVAHRRLKPPFVETYRLQVGDYRAMYTLDHASKMVRVVAVDHRSRIYRR